MIKLCNLKRALLICLAPVEESQTIYHVLRAEEERNDSKVDKERQLTFVKTSSNVPVAANNSITSKKNQTVSNAKKIQDKKKEKTSCLEDLVTEVRMSSSLSLD